jgi:aminopeptidase N
LHNPKNPGHYARPTAVQQQIGPLNKYRNCYDVNHYALEIKINAQKQTIEGRVRIYATALKNLDILQVDLYQNMELIDVQLNDSPAAFLRKSNAIMIYNLENTHAEKAFKLTIHYRGKPMKAANPPWSGGFVWKKDKEKNPWLGVACESEGASLWWPNKDHNSDEADSVSVKLIVPEGLTGVSNGVLRKRPHIKVGLPLIGLFPIP